MSLEDVEPLEEALQPSRRPSIFAAFGFRNFRLLWIGLLFSNLGSWMQVTAIGFLVVHDAPSAEIGALHLGFVGLSQAIPALIISPIAGVAADTFPRRLILWNTNALSALLAIGLVVLVTSNAAGLWQILVISAIGSAVRSFDAPARQSWVPQLVDRRSIANAVGLNSLAFHAPSIIGPSIAGIMIGTLPMYAIFLTNAILTLTVVGALTLMDAAPRYEKRKTKLLAALFEGTAYLVRDPVLRWVMLTLIISALCVRPYLLLLPSIGINALHANPGQLGLLYAAGGGGAIAGALSTAALGNVRYRSRLWAGSCAGLGASVIFLGLAPTVYAALPWLVTAGFSTMLFVGTTNILIQTITPEHLRGRAIAAYSMSLLGLVPLGALFLGVIAQVLGLHATLALCGGVVVLAIGTLWLCTPEIRNA